MHGQALRRRTMSRVVWRVALVAAAVGVAACRATTTRPPFVPFPEAEHAEIGFGIPDPVETIARATRVLAEALRADSIPVTMVHEVDGYMTTPWFDAGSLTPTGRRPLGPDVVRVRGWVNPSKPGFSDIEIETIYRPVADPSRPDRELEAPVPPGHPVGERVARVVKALVEQYGEPEEAEPVRAAPGPPPVRDTAAARDTAAVRDTTTSRDSVPPRDTSNILLR